MTDRDRHDHDHEHQGHGHGPPWSGNRPWSDGPPWGGGKPPWWPEDETWPPRGPDAWRGMRRHFVRKFVGVLAILVASIIGLSALINVLVFRGEHRGRFAPFAIVLVALAVFLVARAGRRLASPVAEIMEAADRVAAGDYETRVQERGPREVQRLGRAFNEMTERLGSNEERRRQLLADVTHELRTPLSVVQANLEALIDGLYPLDEEHLHRVLGEAEVMSRLLDDLQTLSTAEAGVLRLHREPVPPHQLVDAVVAAFSAQAEEKGVRIDADTGGPLPEIDVDRLRIGEVLTNLLSNALRHTPEGGRVVVGANATPDGVAFAVSDTGPGIPPEQLPHVFDRFTRAPDSPGAGLGLAIAKTLVEAHGGGIRAESRPGATTITFTLPAVPD